MTTPSDSFEGQKSKYWSQQNPENKLRFDALIIFLLNDHTKCFIRGVNCRNAEVELNQIYNYKLLTVSHPSLQI